MTLQELLQGLGRAIRKLSYLQGHVRPIYESEPATGYELILAGLLGERELGGVSAEDSLCSGQPPNMLWRIGALPVHAVEHARCLSAIVGVRAASVVASAAPSVERVRAAYLGAGLVVGGRHGPVLVDDPLLPALDLLLQVVQVVQEDLARLLVQRVLVVSLILYLQVVKLKVKTLLLLLLVFQGFKVLNVIASLSLFRALILIPHKRECGCERIRVLFILECEVLQRNDIVLHIVMHAPLGTVAIELSNDERP